MLEPSRVNGGGERGCIFWEFPMFRGGGEKQGCAKCIYGGAERGIVVCFIAIG